VDEYSRQETRMSRPIRSGVSVVVPCHDSSGTIRAALDSALAQTFDSFEIVVVDDGSSDRTPEIVGRYEREHPGLVRLVRSDHRGPYAARNLGARVARGAFLAFLDSDDLWEPPKLERQVALMRSRPDVVLCHTGGRTMTADGKPLRTFHPQPDYVGDCFVRLLVRNRLATSSVLMRRAFFLELGGFDETFEARGDWELWTRAARHGELAAIDEPLIRYRLHDGRMSNDTDRMRRSHLLVIEKHRNAYRDVPHLARYIRESRFRAHMDYGGEYLGAGRTSSARGEALRALLQKPFEAGGWKLLARSVLGKERIARIRAVPPGPEGELGAAAPRRAERG
jgi:glycosyltransferase involved in cell wall biosynthesis